MRKARFKETEIVRVLKEVEGSRPVSGFVIRGGSIIPGTVHLIIHELRT